MWPKVIGLLLASTIVAVLIGTHGAATLDTEVSVVGGQCPNGNVTQLEVTTSNSALVDDIVWHVWGQQQRVQFAWESNDQGSTIGLTPPAEEARLKENSSAQVMANIGQRRAYAHFNTGEIC